MSVAIYIANRDIQVVVGTESQKKVTVQHVYRTQAPEGSLINGIVTDQDALCEHLKSFFDSNNLPHKKITIVLNSSEIVSKTIEVPAMSDRRTIEFIARGFVDVKRAQNPVYSFWPLNPDDKKQKIRKLFVCMSERDLIDSYLTLFKKAGLQVSGITSGIGASLRILQRMPSIRNNTCVVQMLDGHNLTNVLFVNGEYTYSSTSRLFNEHGTIEFGVEIARNVNTMMQFAQTRQIDISDMDIFACGLRADDRGIYYSSIEQLNPNLHVLDLNAGSVLKVSQELISTYNIAVPCGGLLLYSKWQSFLVHYAKSSGSGEQMSELKKSLIIPGVILAIGLASTVILLGMLFVKNHTYSLLQEYNTDPMVVQQCDEYDQLSAVVAKKQAEVDAIQSLCENIYTYPTYNHFVHNVINDCAEKENIKLTLSNFDAAAGVLTVAAGAVDVSTIHRYIKILNKEPMFTKIDYTGYIYQNDTGYWGINVTCYFAESAGRDAEKKEKE